MPRAADRAPLIFLYGTLMRGEPAQRLLAGRATFIGDGHVGGTLADLGRFPGLIAGRRRVWGELWRLEAPELLRTLDEYEGYNFERCRTTATLASGRRVRALVYRYRGEHTRIIPEGHWRRHRWR